MADYDKTYIITPELRKAMIRELKAGRIIQVLETLKALDPCYPTGRL